MNPRYPFGVYTISNRARSASYATSPCARFVASSAIIQHNMRFVNPYFYFFKKEFYARQDVVSWAYRIWTILKQGMVCYHPKAYAILFCEVENYRKISEIHDDILFTHLLMGGTSDRGCCRYEL